MSAGSKSLVAELYNVPDNGKAEIIHGRVVRIPPFGAAPARAAGKIYVRLAQHEGVVKRGYAFTGSVAYLVDLPGRGSFSPDASFHIADEIADGFLGGAPVLPSKFAAKAITGLSQSAAFATRSGITLPPVRRSCGTWTCCKRS